MLVNNIYNLGEKEIISISGQHAIEIILYSAKISDVIKWQHFWQYVLIDYHLIVLADSRVLSDQVVKYVTME